MAQTKEAIRGKLSVFMGPMFAQKTTNLQQELKKYPHFLALKPSMDNRYSEGRILNHDEAETQDEEEEKRGIPALNIDAKNPDIITPVKAYLIENPLLEVVGLDEVNFISSMEQIWPQIAWILALGIDVLAAGLERNTERNLFGVTSELSKRADEVIMLMATCHVCGNSATETYSAQNLNGKEKVGGAEMYQPCCVTCWEILELQKLA